MQSFDYRNILKTWDIEFNTTRIDKNISGSSERTDFRVVIEDEKNKLYVLEKINRNQYKNKLMINKTLQYLFDKGLKKIQPYIKNINFDYISEIDDCLWQLQPYISNIELNRPKYVFDGWRGEILAEFLIDLWKKSKNLSYFDKNNPFDLRDYFLDMKQKMKIYNKSEYNRLKNQIKYIEKNFLNIYYEIPILFCHGDYHPLNIIWTKNDIKSVIDWEFTGYKSEIYDISNLLGCIGIEEPTSLVNKFAINFVNKIKESDIISDISFDYIIEYMATLRFAWLAEWLKKNDAQMIDLEITYIKLLINKKKYIKKELNLK